MKVPLGTGPDEKGISPSSTTAKWERNPKKGAFNDSEKEHYR
jgi:hypothetical protein